MAIEFPDLPQPKATKYTDANGKLIAPDLAVDAPMLDRLPSASEMLSLSKADLLNYLQRFRVIDDWPRLVTEAQAYNARMSALSPDSPDWEDQIRNLVSTESRRGLLGLTRRMSERYQTLEAMDGDPTTEFVRISEGDSAVCEVCQDLAGSIGTYAQHMQNAPGAASCLGGDYCRCVLVAVE